ncbi:MAG: GNAT family N-acetyltransferase [Gammaproteobacteria bacterium]
MDIRIRRAEPGDAAALKALFSSKASVRGTLAMPYPEEGFWRGRIEQAGPGNLHLLAESGNQLLGMGSLHFDPAALRRRHAAEVGLVVDPGSYRRGVGRALLEALVDLADNWLNLRRLELTVYADNAAAIALYEKAGFQREGLHRDYAFRDGAFADAVCMARLHP